VATTTSDTESSPTKLLQDPSTAGVKTLLGDPKKAIIKLSIPMIIAMSANTIYNVTDAVWVSGLGSSALAAVGYVFPFFIMAMAFATGVGVGGGAAISRRIGSKDKQGADSTAVHTLLIMVLIALTFTVIFYFFIDEVFMHLIVDQTTFNLAVSYAKLIALGTIVVFFAFIATAILRSEGDANRAMIALLFGSGLNIVLDPIFIYTLNFGIEGAAYATVLSMSIASLILFYWLFLKKNTYITFHFKDFHLDNQIIKDILRVGIPASLMQLSMSIMMVIMNEIISGIKGDDAVAIYTVGWRIATIAILPLVGMSTAVVSVTGAAYGAKEYLKLKVSYYYAIKIGFLIELVIAILTFIGAPVITLAFTQAENSASLAPGIITLLQIICIFYPMVAFGMFSSSMFQGIGKGVNSLIVTLFRTIILTTPISLLFAYTFDLGLVGVWWGLVVANTIGSTVAFLWGRHTIFNLNHKPDPQVDKS